MRPLRLYAWICLVMLLCWFLFVIAAGPTAFWKPWAIGAGVIVFCCMAAAYYFYTILKSIRGNFQGRQPCRVWDGKSMGFKSPRAVCIGLYLRDRLARKYSILPEALYPQDDLRKMFLYHQRYSRSGELPGLVLLRFARLIPLEQWHQMTTIVDVANYIDATVPDAVLRQNKIMLASPARD
ncbi:hypothetical protein DBR44_16295 [Aquitalea sp. FJL05]|uniref:hypothetical protein n=1 Tax=Aquitalea sp. FJL05 TaxID=2153366 RepID=UPI000F5975AE|nr:hypothetical protein [Aquitalea sp. FJL05]RQO68233.1 hypothetical protein DBR44_16295 [Aquitalea sp. FJL05]